mmetsp:Transcript_14471/g.21330  ORF Transcript_14471/g.21330 Transcript_14471/m.21330 type:complete len:140 (+) Transcript_14471:2-421(+)
MLFCCPLLEVETFVNIVMRDDKLARLLFFVGCAGLPWLWAVHLMYYLEKKRKRAAGEDDESNNDQDALLNGESSSDSEDDAPAEQILLLEKKWVKRESVGLILVVFAWVSWIVVFQILKDSLPSWLLVRGENDAERTGW